jgi:CBS-domain-containing membrane protein
MKIGLPPGGARVQDVMTEAVMCLNANHTQDEAAEILRVREVSGAPVLGYGGHLVGIVTLSDLADPRRRKPLTRGLVEDAMTRVVYAVRATDPAMHAVRLMLNEHIHRALVVNDDGTIAGIVSPTDILRALARGVDVRAPSPSGTPVQYVDLHGLARSRGTHGPR